MLRSLVSHADKLKYLAVENSPLIFTAVGVVGTVTTAVLTGRATFKAAALIDEHQLILDTDCDEEDLPPVQLSRTEKTKLVWREYIPPVAIGSVTVASIVLAQKINSKRIAAFGIAALASDRALTEYKEKVIEKLGVRQDEKIRDEVAQDRVTNNPPKSGEVVMVGSGQVLCYDMLTGRYFNSTIEDIKRAENAVNYELIHFMSCSLSHFYDEIGLPPTPYTDSVGWNLDNNMEVKFSTVMSEDNRPCVAIEFSKPPRPDYEKTWN